MANLFKHTEIAERFKIPSHTTRRWVRSNDWRKELYVELEHIHAKELAEKAIKMSDPQTKL